MVIINNDDRTSRTTSRGGARIDFKFPAECDDPVF